MGRGNKIHCRSNKLVGLTNCDKKQFYVKSVYGWVFDQLQIKSKCKNCVKKRNSDGQNR